MIRSAIRAAMIAGLCAAPVAAAAQSLCYRPEPPPDIAPPDDDPELRAFLSEEYARYLEDVEDYLNCANDEAHAVMAESRAALARWTAYYGAEAGIRARCAHSDTSDRPFRRHPISCSGVSGHPELSPLSVVW